MNRSLKADRKGIMQNILRAVEQICPTVRDADMRQYTTFKIGGKAALLAMPENVRQLADVVRLCKDVPHDVIGNGSNLLIGDGGYKGVLIRLSSGFSDITVSGTVIRAQAGATLAALAARAMEAGLSGLAFAGGIPGTVGGAVLMNAGAYGGEMADIVVASSCLDPKTGTAYTVREHAFSYRHSIYQENGCIVTDVSMQLLAGDREEIRSTMETLAAKRRASQPLQLPSAGSAFRRPTGGYAAQMIDEAGLRGYRIGGAQVSEKHAGFIVNIGGATARDVRQLISHIQETVYAAKHVMLKPEIRFLGEFT